MNCPNCDGKNVSSAKTLDKFMYGTGPTPVELAAEVTVFTCASCEESWTGEQAEEARQAAVDRHWLEQVPQLVIAIRMQHEAIDRLFAMLIAKTMHAETPFYPSESGQPWDALVFGKAALEEAGVQL